MWQVPLGKSACVRLTKHVYSDTSCSHGGVYEWQSHNSIHTATLVLFAFQEFTMTTNKTNMMPKLSKTLCSPQWMVLTQIV